MLKSISSIFLRIHFRQDPRMLLGFVSAGRSALTIKEGVDGLRLC